MTTIDEARQLFEQHQGMALGAAKRFRQRLPRSLVSFDELHAAALGGLWKACLRHDASYGQFWFFARRFIHGAILVYLRSLRSQGRVWKEREKLDSDPVYAQDQTERPAEVSDLVQLVIRSLPATQGRLLSLRFLSGMNCEEAAAAMGVTYQAAAHLMCRAIDRARENLAEHGDDVRAVLDARTERNPYRSRRRNRSQRLRSVHPTGESRR